MNGIIIVQQTLLYLQSSNKQQILGSSEYVDEENYFE